MGYAISVVAFQGLDRAQVMERAKLADGPGRGRRREAWWLGEIDGWLILWGECGYASPERLAVFSQGARVVGLDIEEHVMVSGAAEFRDGARIWMMAHDPDTDVEGVDVAGEPPAGFAAVLAELEREQREYNDEGEWVDVIFDAPIEAARLVTGYRHDEHDPAEDPRFVAVHLTASEGLDDAPAGWRRGAAPMAPLAPPRPLTSAEVWPRRLARLAVIPALAIAALGVTVLLTSGWDPAAILIALALTGGGILAARHVWRSGSLVGVILLGFAPLLMALVDLVAHLAGSPYPENSPWTYVLAVVGAIAIYGAVRLDDVRRDLRLD